MIQTPLKWIAWFVVCFLLQTTVISSISIMGVKPDLLILVLFLFAVKNGVLPATYVGFILGLAQDIYTPGILGQNALAKTIIGSFAGLFNEKTVRVDPIFQIVLLVIVFLLNDTVDMVVLTLKSGGSFITIFTHMFTATLPRALYSLVFAAVPFIWQNYIQPASRR